MNTDDKRLEELARNIVAISDPVDRIHSESCTRIILAALHKAVEPYRKREQELRAQLESTVKGSFGATQAMAIENAALRKQVEGLKAELQLYRDEANQLEHDYKTECQFTAQLQAEKTKLAESQTFLRRVLAAIVRQNKGELVIDHFHLATLDADPIIITEQRPFGIYVGVKSACQNKPDMV